MLLSSHTSGSLHYCPNSACISDNFFQLFRRHSFLLDAHTISRVTRRAKVPPHFQMKPLRVFSPLGLQSEKKLLIFIIPDTIAHNDNDRLQTCFSPDLSMCEARRRGPTLCRTGRQASFLAPSHSTGFRSCFQYPAPSQSTTYVVCLGSFSFFEFSAVIPQNCWCRIFTRRCLGFLSLSFTSTPGHENHWSSSCAQNLFVLSCFSPACLLYFGLDLFEILVQIQQRRGLIWFHPLMFVLRLGLL